MSRVHYVYMVLFYFFPVLSSVTPSFEAIKDQNICNKIMVKLIQNYSNIFETNPDKEDHAEETPTVIIVKVCTLFLFFYDHIWLQLVRQSWTNEVIEDGLNRYDLKISFRY